MDNLYKLLFTNTPVQNDAPKPTDSKQKNPSVENIDRPYSDLLEKYNRKDHTLAGIWEDIGKRCPFIVRRYDSGKDYQILVTRIYEGVGYGFPLVKGQRIYNEWYTTENPGSVRIPENGSEIWQLIDTPFDDLEKILFRIELHSEDNAPLSAGEVQIDGGINPNVIMPFGKYRDRKVGDIIQTDPGYISWALDNIAGFRNRIYSKSA